MTLNIWSHQHHMLSYDESCTSTSLTPLSYLSMYTKYIHEKVSKLSFYHHHDEFHMDATPYRSVFYSDIYMCHDENKNDILIQPLHMSSSPLLKRRISSRSTSAP